MEEINLKDLLDYFRGKIVWILATILVFIVVGNIYTIITRVPMYRSDTTIILVNEKQQENNYNTAEQQYNKALVGSYTEIIRSRKVLEQVNNNLKLKSSYGELKSNVNVESVNNTEIIKISVNNADNKKAAKIADEIAVVFGEEVKGIYKLNNVSILDKAEVSTVPYNINYLKDNAIYILLGLVLSCGVVFVFFYFDTTIKTSEEIENKLGLTILGIVPKVEGDK